MKDPVRMTSSRHDVGQRMWDMSRRADAVEFKRDNVPVRWLLFVLCQFEEGGWRLAPSVASWGNLLKNVLNPKCLTNA